MALTRWDPLAELEALHNQVNNMFTHRTLHEGLTSPVTDVYKEDNHLVVEVHLPHFAEEDIAITCNDHALEIRATHEETQKDKREYMVHESSSQFYRHFALPREAQEENITASFKEGVLKVLVPLKTLSEGKKINISEGKKTKAKK
jgi:HSP20 family protein